MVCVPVRVYVHMYVRMYASTADPHFLASQLYPNDGVAGCHGERNGVFAYLTTLFDPTKWAFLAMLSIDCSNLLLLYINTYIHACTQAHAHLHTQFTTHTLSHVIHTLFIVWYSGTALPVAGCFVQ